MGRSGSQFYFSALKMTLFIDPREGSKDLISIHPIPDLSPVHCPLNSGDVAFCGKGPNNSSILIGVELKKLSDLLTSIDTKRIQGGQIPKLVKDYPVRWILYYGRFRVNPKDNKSLQEWKEAVSSADAKKRRKEGWYTCKLGERTVLYSALQGFLSGPSLWGVGIQVARVETKEEAAHWIAALYHQWHKPFHEHRCLRTLDGSQDPSAKIRNAMRVAIATGLPHTLDQKFAERLKFANAIPNIGYERAYAIAGYFPSVKAMVLATKEEWSMVEVQTSSGRTLKIGPVMARAIVEYFS